MPVVFYCLLVWLLNIAVLQGDEIRATFAMDADPQFQVPDPVKVFSNGYKPLWLQTLARPEADLQRISAETIAQAHEFGFPGMTEARPRLLEILAAKQSHPTARFAAARALIVMDTRDAAPALFEASRHSGTDLRQLIEPQLGIWKFQPLAAVWRNRLTASDIRHRDLLLAIEGAAQLEDQESVPALLIIAHDPLKTPATRLAAARAAGKLQKAGLESDATRLSLSSAVNASVINRLCALHLILNHDSEAARTHLLQLAGDREPSIAAAAWGRLLAIGPDLVVPIAEGALNSPDPIVRQRGTEAYMARPSPERVVRLTQLLDDPHPTVRGRVRDALYVLTKTPEFDAALRPAVMKVLAAESWRGQEQAALLLGTLDHEPAAPRLIQLLESPREEVLTTSAWALRKLAVADTLPAVLDKAQRQTAVREIKSIQPESLDVQVVHLFELLGLMKYAPAEPLFRKYIPKNFGLGQHSRGAAIWALGHLYEDRPDAALVKLFSERMQDTLSSPPEALHVQVMSIIALGRMQAKSEIKNMQGLRGKSAMPLQPDLALRWALMRLTGESLPEAKPLTYSKSAWFLTPLEQPAAAIAP